MTKSLARVLGALLALAFVATACASDDEGGSGDDGGDGGAAPAEEIDYEEIGLWDDGPCDEAAEPLVVGLITTFESPVISLGDQALALDAAADAFNERGGANGACIEVHSCDENNDADRALACVDEMDEAGVMVTINDQGLQAQKEVSEAFAELGIPRLAGNVSNNDWGDQNAYPLDASGTGSTFLMPQALVDAGAKEIGLIRVGGGAAAMKGLLEPVYRDEGVTFVYDGEVPAGTTDFTQFIQGAEEAGATGVMLALGEQEAVQVVRAAQQLGTDLTIGGTLGTFSHSSVAEMGDFADQLALTWSYPPATAGLPVYAALRDDLAASGEEGLQPENLKASPMRSWIGLYGLLWMLRDAEPAELSRESIKATIEAAEDVPMLDMFGGEDWTPDTDHPGMFQRAGVNHWATYEWDPDAEGEFDGNFVEIGEMSFDDVACGSIIGAPAATC
jgi:ABC-type branched-subunit amino acid transport system substrate-binding protein